MGDSPRTPGIVPGPSLPGLGGPIDRNTIADPDLPGTARTVAKSIEALVQHVEQLNKRVDDNLVREIKDISVRVDRGKRALRLTILGLIIAFGLILAVGWLAARQQNLVTENRRVISDLQEIQMQAEISRTQAQCPLYRLFLGSRSAVGRERYPEGPQAYDRAFADIEMQARAIRCDVSS